MKLLRILAVVALLFSVAPKVSHAATAATDSVAVDGTTASPTPTATAPGLPNTGEAPLQNDQFPWSVLGSAALVAVVLGYLSHRANRNLGR